MGDPGGGWPNTFVDVALGIDHLRELATSHRLDIDRVFAVGHSVGANFAIWAAARPKIPESSDVYMPQRLVIGAYDQAWGPSGRAYYDAGLADGSAPVTMVEAPESGHFEVIAPQSSTWRNVLTELRRLVEGN